MTSPEVFVSRPTMLTRLQAQAHRRWLSDLSTLGFEAVSLERQNYAPVPWNQLRDAVGRADGVLVLGFRQMSVEAGSWRPGTGEAVSAAGWYATPWNQLEAGLAIVARVPVLVAAEAGIRDGVFSPDLWTEDVYGLAIEDRVSGPDASLSAARETFQAWARAVNRRATANTRSPETRAGG
jgi:hypothetical protein